MLKTGCSSVQDALSQECFALVPIYILTAKWGKETPCPPFFFRDKQMQLNLGTESAVSCAFEQT